MRSVSLKLLILSVIFSFLALFLNGLWEIKTDDTMFNFASFSLITSQFIIFLTLSFFSYWILGALKNPRRRLAIIIAAVVFILLWFYFLFDYILPPAYYFYVIAGRFLADRFGVNWFWMDWGVWVQCTTIYLFGVYLYLINLFMNFFKTPNTLKKKEK